MTEFQKKRMNAIRESINNEWSEKYMSLIEKHPEKPWNWNGISRNPNITMEFIEKHPEKPWNWYNISSNPNLTMEFIEKHPEKPWNWNSISYNPNLTMEFIEKHPEKAWNWEGIEENTLNVLHYDDYDDNINEYDDEGYNSEDNY